MRGSASLTLAGLIALQVFLSACAPVTVGRLDAAITPRLDRAEPLPMHAALLIEPDYLTKMPKLDGDEAAVWSWLLREAVRPVFQQVDTISDWSEIGRRPGVSLVIKPEIWGFFFQPSRKGERCWLELRFVILSVTGEKRDEIFADGDALDKDRSRSLAGAALGVIQDFSFQASQRLSPIHTIPPSLSSVANPVDWTAHSTLLGEYRVEYALPPGGVALQAPAAERKLKLTKHEKVALFASLGFGPGSENAPPPTRLSIGFGRIPGGTQPETPSVERLGQLVLGEALASHQAMRYHYAIERVGDQTWFRLETHLPGSDGVQPEATVYYQSLDASHYLFVWGFWGASVRATQQDVEDRRRMLQQVVERCRVTH